MMPAVCPPVRALPGRRGRWVGCTVVCVVLCACSPAVKAQGSDDLDLWMRDVPVGVLVEQLAQLRGLDAGDDPGMASTVSGRFKGSLTQVLNAVSNQVPVVFDMHSGVLSAADADSVVQTTITVQGVESDNEQTQLAALIASSAPELAHHAIDVSDNTLVISGPPESVQRTISRISEAVTENFEEAEIRIVQPDVTDDIASQVISEEIAAPSPETESDVVSSTREFRWVTDIPGFDTF